MRNFIRSALAAAFLASVAAAPTAALAAAQALETGPAGAIEACLAFSNEYGPVTVETYVNDGYGDVLVWLVDRDGDYWACNADLAGNVYVYAMVGEDLLDGDGQTLVSTRLASFGGADPYAAAAELCRVMLGDGGQIVHYFGDGLGDVMAWVEDSESLYLCNATADGIVWLFEQVDGPLDGSQAAVS